MIRRELLHTAAALALATTILAPHGATHAAGGVLLRARFSVGQQFGSVETKVSTTTFAMKIGIGSSASQKMTQSTHEKDVIPSTTTIVKVLPDGSALSHTTYGTVTVTSDGKTTTSAMKGYYEEDHVSTRLQTISSKVYGATGIPAAVLSAVNGNSGATSATALYPKGPVSVGSTWSASETFPGMGKLAAQLTVLGFGTQAGRQTVTIQYMFNQPLQYMEQGLTLSGPMIGSEKDTIVIDSGQDAVPVQSGFSWKGKLSGLISGAKVTGSFILNEVDSTVPVK